jgi:hypothetical protein
MGASVAAASHPANGHTGSLFHPTKSEIDKAGRFTFDLQ